MDLAKRDMSFAYGGRTFAVRAYEDGRGPDGPGWHTVVIEHRTPVRHGLGPSPSEAECFAAAVRYLTAAVDAQAGPVLPPA